MPLQDISPINDQLADIIVRADEPWIESSAGQAWMKVLWVGPETGRWAALFRWKKGYIASPQAPFRCPYIRIKRSTESSRWRTKCWGLRL